jgi:hypothetical protein
MLFGAKLGGNPSLRGSTLCAILCRLLLVLLLLPLLQFVL